MTPSYLLGLFFILLVVIIWSFASILVQHIYRNEDFDSPFLLTYVCTSLFVILLPNRIIWDYVSSWCGGGEQIQIAPWRSGPIEAQYKILPRSNHVEENELTHLNEEHKESKHVDKAENPKNVESIDIEQAPAFKIDTTIVNENAPVVPENFILGHYETLHISMVLAPIWFLSNYFYNLSLQMTSISSSTIIASTGSLFTFIIAVYTKDEKYTLLKGSGVGLCVFGSIITGLNDTNGTKTENVGMNTALWGDFLGLLSAIGYGLYTVLIRLKCPKDEKHISMQLLFGYLGLLNMTVLSPVVIYQYLTYRFQQIPHEESTPTNSAPWITWTVLGLLVLKGLFDNVLSDYLWARSIVLTSATIATVGLGLTIPLAFLSDWFINDMNPSVNGIIGALSVLIGFVLVNV